MKIGKQVEDNKQKKGKLIETGNLSECCGFPKSLEVRTKIVP